MGDGMKKYKASDLSHKRAEVMKEARSGGVIIQECRTNGDVLQEYVILTKEYMRDPACNEVIRDELFEEELKEIRGK